ncbi:glycosyltransferase family 2 protein [Celerinatantimonas sp. YJH-8]|uniref:glycosyltransferase family 2 protein n=1 Tax=Celerinatantimonas sp. YJH-8 TaxID=3228714 RepID=UPI0038C3FDD6
MKFAIIVPVFNEELAIPRFYQTLKDNSELSHYDIEVTFINDGSSDRTESIIDELSIQDHSIKKISFTRHFGKEIALFAGLKHVEADAIIPIDVDLQDPIEVIPQLIQKWLETKAESVLAKRADRESDSFFKRNSAKLYYKIYNAIAETEIEENVGDFRIISKTAAERITSLTEHDLFMKGVYSFAGGKTELIEYTRDNRVAGKSKFNFIKLFHLGFNGILSSSSLPLKIWMYIGLIVMIPSFIFFIIQSIEIIFSIGSHINSLYYISNIILLVCGIQLTSIGVIGEYIWKIYNESRNRPRYFIKNK